MNGQEKSLFSESLATDENRLGFESLADRLERYACGKKRALDMTNYITERCGGKKKTGRPPENLRLVAKMETCGSYLVFKHYFNRDEVRLHAAKFCKKHMLCPFCAMRRGAKYVQAYQERLAVVLNQRPGLRAFMVTLTIKDGEDLKERFNKLRSGLKKYQQQRRDALKGQRFVEYAKAMGGVFSIEIKRGRNSGQWHPHVHMIWLCHEMPDVARLSLEWLEITGDSYIVDVREFYGDSVTDGFLEVFKYALKFSDMALADNWEAYETLKGKRLVDSFGLFRGVEVPESLLDDDLDNEAYRLLLYRFSAGTGYNFIATGEHEIFEHMKR